MGDNARDVFLDALWNRVRPASIKKTVTAVDDGQFVKYIESPIIELVPGQLYRSCTNASGAKSCSCLLYTSDAADELT